MVFGGKQPRGPLGFGSGYTFHYTQIQSKAIPEYLENKFQQVFYENQRSFHLTPVPRNFRPNNLAFTGEMIWDDNPPEPGVNISLIPYISGGYAVDFPRGDKLEELPHDKSSTKGIGMDARWPLPPLKS
ncbi:MAG: hypothetical protein IPH28_23260 [Cytophagaceae bacterium]|nr:hypothetical protein [Cytophagaceae bacterium]